MEPAELTSVGDGHLSHCRWLVPFARVRQPRIDAARQIDRLLGQAREDANVLAVVIFGSTARGEATRTSDVDVCLVLRPRSYDSLSLSRTKLAYCKEWTWMFRSTSNCRSISGREC